MLICRIICRHICRIFLDEQRLYGGDARYIDIVTSSFLNGRGFLFIWIPNSKPAISFMLRFIYLYNSTILDKKMCLSHSSDHLQDIPWRAAAVRRWCDSLLRFRGPQGPKSKNVHRALPGSPRNLQALLRLRSGGSVRHRSGHLNIFFHWLFIGVESLSC